MQVLSGRLGFPLLVPLFHAVAERSGRSLISEAPPAVDSPGIMHTMLP
ncbi:hypothetical protein NGM36_35995 [Streptomyces mutabilis]|nr:hypothetical protein [Streptomyces mutabilis]MCZ9355097.1 hypothetical protein [Streptomyces mutabilis]